MKIVLIFLFAWSLSGFALEPTEEKVWDVAAQTWITPAELASKFHGGEAVVLGEEHATASNRTDVGIRIHHDNQLRLMSLIAARGASVSVGMEFLPYTLQAGVDAYLAGEMSEDEFRTLVGWEGDAFDIYLRKARFPLAAGGKTVALNIPRSITRKVSQSGPDALDASERSLLPPIWEFGSSTYFERFSEAMIGHVPEEMIRNYFWAQSLWDDTMAWRTARFLSRQPDQILMVVVGAFHAEFMDGLPARMNVHGVPNVKVILQQEVATWDEEELLSRTRLDSRYGNRADFLWFWRR